MGWFWSVLVIVWIVVWVATVVNIIQRRHERTTAATFAWIILVFVFSILGTLTYLIVNGMSTGRPAVEPGPPRPGSQ